MSMKLVAQKREKQRNEIRMLQIKKLQEVNKFLKQDNAKLANDNQILSKQCSGLKDVMMNYEKEAIYQRLESDVSP